MDLIPIIQYQDGLEQLATLALRRELIPFFGAGFTSGCLSCEGVVPDAQNAMTSMRKLILKSNAPFSETELKTFDFFGLSDLFFEYVAPDDRALYFEQNYTGVTLYSPQREFLSTIDWPYAYTINIDDGIEKNSTFTPILPYRKLRRPRTSKKLLYKLHGDALHECTYRETSENIVFSQSQYMQAITHDDNTDIYQQLLADYGQRHLLFIGCSLQSEQDLVYIYQKSLEYRQETYRFVLRTAVPSTIEQQNLKKHGVNEIILIDNFEQFYPDFIAQYKKLQEKSRDAIYEHINPTVISTQNKIESLNLLAGNNIFDGTKNQFTKGAFHILRNVVNQIAKDLQNNVCVLLKGRRFSGKTYVLCSLTERFKTRDIFYFPSAIFADEEIVERLLSNSKNSLFLFDSNSITPDVYGLLIKSNSVLEERNNKLVIAINSSDNYMPTQLKCSLVELSNLFRGSEITSSCKALDSFGLTRRKLGQTNIDFLYALKREQNVEIPFNDKADQNYTSAEKRIIFALCALDKLYYSDLIALNFTTREVAIICAKTDPFIEIIPTGSNESTRHSNKKLVHNSKIALTEIVKLFTEEDIINSILYIVKKFHLDYSRRRLYIEIILFDTLNQLFSGRNNSRALIASIYAQLQPLLKDDLHYWLQRAKSIYRTTNSKQDLNEAYTYAKKAYLDGSESLYVKAALTAALISCALSELDDEIENKLIHSEKAVALAHESVFSEYFRLNPSYLQAELPIGKDTNSEHRISNACNHVIKHSKDSDLILKSEDILNRFETLRSNSLNQRKKR